MSSLVPFATNRRYFVCIHVFLSGFSKLTLSSNKKQNKREENEELDNDGEVSQENVKTKHDKRQSASRNLMEELSQESSSSPQNPLLRSESSKEQSNGNNVSSHFTDYETMDPLNVTEDDDDDEEEEHSHATTENQTPPILDVVVDDLLHKISAMDIISRPISISSTCSSSIGGTQPSHDLNEVTQLISTESQRSSMGDVRTFHNIIEVPVKTVFKKEIVSVTPKSNIQHRETQNNEYEMTEDEDEDEEVEVERLVEHATEEHSVVDDDDDEDEAITISDTSNSEVAEEEPSEMAMSAMNPARGTLAGLSPEKIDRMTAFLRDVSIERRNLEENGHASMENFEYDEYLPTKAHRIATADTESMTPEGEEDEGEDKVTKKSLLERQERLKAFAETKQEETSQIYEDEANATRSPEEEENNVRRLANDETQENSIMTDLQFSPSQHYDIKEEKTPQNKARRIVSAETQENTTNFELEEVLATSVITPKNETPKKSARRLISAETEENTIQTEGQLDLSSASHGTSSKEHKTPLKSDHRRLLLDETEENTQLSLSASSSPEKNNDDKDNAKRLANDDTEVNTEFSTNSSQELKVNEKKFFDADTEVDRSISVPSSPDIKNEPKNIAEADTEIDNSVYVASSPEMKTPLKSYGSVNSLASSSSPVNDTAPEHSITILETDDEDEDAQPKSPQSDDNNKLSTSFHKDEYVSSGDDSDSDDQMSQIQMSMANINISAKINIKIHIPDSTETSEDGGDSSDNRRRTLDSLPEQPKRKQTPSKGANRESIPSQNTEIIRQSKKTPSKSLKNNYLSPNNSQNDSFDHEKSNGDEEISSCPSSDNSCAIVEEDEQFVDVAQKLLNQLYGNSWQTPDVIRTLTRTSGSAENNRSNVKNATLRNQHKSKEKPKKTDIKECSLKVAEESVLGDFSMCELFVLFFVIFPTHFERI